MKKNLKKQIKQKQNKNKNRQKTNKQKTQTMTIKEGGRQTKEVGR